MVSRKGEDLMDVYAIINIVLILFAVICAVACVRVDQLISAIFILGCYSFFLAILWAVLGAVDVSFTEAMIGVGASTIFLLVALFETSDSAVPPVFNYKTMSALIAVSALGLMFIWGSIDMPRFGDTGAPPHIYLSPYFLTHAVHDMHTPNVVTAILADYRSFDTLIETVVIFTAGISCLLVMRSKI